MADTITIKKPFDAHLHLRRAAMLRAVAPLSAAKFGRAIVMPNTDPPIETLDQAINYRSEILSAIPDADFDPLMTLYLTRNVTPAEIERAAVGAEDTKIYGVKYYPYGATTNSQWGYRNILEAKEVLKEMERVQMPLLMHGEVHVDDAGNEVDPYEGEKRFFADVLPRLLDAYPKLKVSLEHMSTRVGAEFMEKNGAAGRLVCTLTPHHLMYDREQAESDPLLRCKPLIKSKADREAVRELARKGLPFVVAGTDSAPHPESKKRSPAGAFGVFSAPVALELYTQVFDELGALDTLENFLSVNGPRFYGLEPDERTVTLEKKEWRYDDAIMTDDGDRVVPMTGSETIRWRMKA